MRAGENSQQKPTSCEEDENYRSDGEEKESG